MTKTMKTRLVFALPLLFFTLAAVGLALGQETGAAPLADPRETHLADVVQLTRAGENAEAYWSPDGRQLVLQSTRPPFACDQIFRMPASGGEPTLVSSGKGRTTCAYFTGDGRRILAQGLVRPTKLEIWVADAGGGNARQVTSLGAASFAPSFFPSGDRILFSSNHGDPKGREFDLWAVDVDGSDLERITWGAGFDGFPLFSPDGTRLVFASNRNQDKPGETNVFVARWVEGAKAEGERDGSFLEDVRWLADDAREGRGVGTRGLEEAAVRISDSGCTLLSDTGRSSETVFWRWRRKKYQ